MTFAAIYFGALGAFCIWVSLPSARRLRAVGERFARENRAFIAGEFVEAFDRESVRTFLSLAVAGATIMTGAWFVMRAEPHGGGTELYLLPIVAVVLAAWGAWRLGHAGSEFPVPEGRPIAARARRVVPRDYLALPAQMTAWISAVVSCALAAVAVIQWRSGDVDGGLALMAAVSSAALLVALVAVQAYVRAICERPQAAVDACHLYFQDAWRGEFVRNAYIVLWWSQFQYVLGVTPWLSRPDFFENGALPILLAYVLAQGAVLQMSSRLRFRKQLWPTLAKNQVLLPGEAPPPRREAFA